MTPGIATLVEGFIAANHETMGSEARDDLDELIGELYVIFAEDPWGNKVRRSGHIGEPALFEKANGECWLELSVETKRLSTFDLHHLRWDVKKGWTAHHDNTGGVIPLESLIIAFV